MITPEQLRNSARFGTPLRPETLEWLANQLERAEALEKENAALIAGLREIATCESKVKGDVVDIAKSILWKYDR